MPKPPTKLAILKTLQGDQRWRVGWKKLRGDWAHIDWQNRIVWFDPRYPSLLELHGYIAHEAGHLGWGLEQEHKLNDCTEHNAVAIAAALGAFTEDD